MSQDEQSPVRIINSQVVVVGINPCESEDSTFKPGKEEQRYTTPISSTMRYHILGFLLFGASNTLVYKYQNTTIIDGIAFTHPFIQTVIMFLGMHMPLYWYLYKSKTKTLNMDLDPSKKSMKHLKDYLHVWVPAFCDFIASTLQFTALNFIDSSVYQMLRGGTIIFTSIFSKWMFRKKFLAYRYAGIGQVVIGLVVVGMSNFFYVDESDNSNYDTSHKLMAIILLIISMVFNGLLYSYEEWIYANYNIHPTKLVGMEGLYGLIIYAILLPILNSTECPFPNNRGCVEVRTIGKDGLVSTKYMMESVSLFFEQIGKDNSLMAFIIIGFITVSFYNVNGLSTTKFFSGLTRSIIDVLRTLIIWVVGLAVTLQGSREWENLDYRSNIMKIFGFLFIVCGNLVYNGLIKLPYLPREKDQDRKFKLSLDVAESDSFSNQLPIPNFARLHTLSLQQRTSQILSQQPQTIQQIHQQFLQFQLKKQQQVQQGNGNFTSEATQVCTASANVEQNNNCNNNTNGLKKSQNTACQSPESKYAFNTQFTNTNIEVGTQSNFISDQQEAPQEEQLRVKPNQKPLKIQIQSANKN